MQGSGRGVGHVSPGEGGGGGNRGPWTRTKTTHGIHRVCQHVDSQITQCRCFSVSETVNISTIGWREYSRFYQLVFCI